MRIGIGLAITQPRLIGSSGVQRTLVSVSVGAFSAGAYPVTLIGDAVDGETVEWVLYSGTDPANGAEVDAGTWAGATVVDSGTFAWAASPSPVTLTTGIARANYKLACIVNNGAVSNAVISSAFEVDTTASLLTLESFTDGGAEDVDWAFTSNEDVTYRVSLWADGSTPSAAQIESGTGSVATVTGTAAATVAETGTFAAVGDGTYVPTIWVSDGYLNEYTETYADVTVAAVSGVTATLITSQGGTSTSGTKTVDLSGGVIGTRYLIGISTVGGAAGNNCTAMTVQGDTATNQVRSSGVSHGVIAEWWEVVLTGAGSGTAAIVCTRATAQSWGLFVYRIDGTVTTRTTNSGSINNLTTAVSANTFTVAPGVVLGISGSDTTETPVLTGLTSSGTVTGVASRVVIAGAHTVTTSESPRTISTDPTPTGVPNVSCNAGFAVIALS